MSSRFFHVQEFQDVNNKTVFSIEIKHNNAFIVYPDGEEYQLQKYEDNGWAEPDGYCVFMNVNGNIRLNFFNLDGDEQEHANDYFDVNRREFFKQNETLRDNVNGWKFVVEKECCTELFREGKDKEIIILPFEYIQ